MFLLIIGHINLSLAFKRKTFHCAREDTDPKQPSADVGEAVQWALGSASRVALGSR